MGFSAEPKKVYELFNRKCYLIPRNQRRYVWEKRNWEELYDDISLVTQKTLPPHFIGSFVLNDEGRQDGLPHYTIIDGQQRIITLTIMLASILFWFKKEKLIDDYLGTTQYVFATDDKAKKRVMLQSDYHLSLETIIKSIDEMPDDQFDVIGIGSFLEISRYSPSSDNNIVNAFKYFMTRIKDEMDTTDNHQKYLLSLRDATLNISDITIIALSEEDSYTIFEILNARGMILEDHELLKNYIMRYIQPEKTRDKAKQVWFEIENDLDSNISKFVKHYAKHVCSYNKSDNLSEYKIIQRANKGRNTDDLLRDLRKKADYYSKMINPIGKCIPNSVEYRVFSFFKKKRQEQLRPVILSLMHQNDLGNIPNELYENVLVFMYNYYVCYNIIGEESSNKLTNVVYKYSELIENHYSEQVLNDFVSDMKKKLPARDIFIRSFENVGWSHHSSFFEGDKNKERSQTVIEVLERYLNHGECLSGFTIEHVLDDADDVSNGQIGNLIPLEEGINSGLSGKEFDEKIKAYMRSNYKTARSFSERYSMSFDPQKRTHYLAALFYDEILKLST